MRAARAAGRRGVVLVDGRSGAGKSTFARQLAEEVRRYLPDLQACALDQWYPGWDGLADGSRILAEDVLGPASHYQAWEWEAGRPGGTVTLEASAPLLVEGCGALTPATRLRADVAVWVDAAADVRRDRALRRDGDLFAPHWERWAAQEDDHIARNDPVALADFCLDTTTPQGVLTCRRP